MSVLDLPRRMTIQVGNFKINPDSIASASDEEANREAGNPGSSLTYPLGRLHLSQDLHIRIFHIHLSVSLRNTRRHLVSHDGKQVVHQLILLPKQ